MKKNIPIFLITFIGSAMRLFRLGYHDFWYDEVEAMFISMRYSPTRDASHLFHSILDCWMRLFGQGEFSVRFPSFLFSVLCIPLTYALGKKLFNSKIAIIATAIMAISPMQLWYAQEAAPYSLVLSLGLLSSYIMTVLIKNGPSGYWLYFYLVSLLGLLSGEFYIMLLVIQTVVLALYLISLKDKKGLRNLVLASVLILLYFLPWGSIYLYKFKLIQRGFWIPRPDLLSLRITFENLLTGYNLSERQHLLTGFLVAIISAASFVSVYRNRDLRDRTLLCISFTLVPIVFVYFFSKTIASVYLDRRFITFSPYYYIFLAIGIERLSRNRTGLVCIGALVVMLTVSLKSFYLDIMPAPVKYHMGTYIKKPVKPLARFIKERLLPGDIIAFSNPSVRPIFSLLIGGSKQYYTFYDPSLKDTNWNRPFIESEKTVPIHKIRLLEADRIWLISSNWSHDGKLDEQSESVKRYLDGAMSLKLARDIKGVWVCLYE